MATRSPINGPELVWRIVNWLLDGPSPCVAPADPDILITPQSIEVTVEQGQTLTQLMLIANPGGANLTFDIEEFPGIQGGVEQAARLGGHAKVEGSSTSPAPEQEAPAVFSEAGAAPAKQEVVIIIPDGGVNPDAGPSVTGGAPGPLNTPDQVVVTPNVVADPPVSVLVVDTLTGGAGFSPIKGILDPFPDTAVVDFIDGTLGTPTLVQLQAYDVVVVASNYFWADRIAMGDVLAAYNDAGGNVVHMSASFDTDDGWGLAGAWVAPDHGAILTSPSYSFDTWTLGNFNPGHPIMDGVTSLTNSIVFFTDFALDALFAAEWNSLEPLAGDMAPPVGGCVVGLNAFPLDGFWVGDMPLLIHNAVVDAAQICGEGAPPPPPPPAGSVLLVKNVQPWALNLDPNETILNTFGVPYVVASSFDLPALDLSSFAVVIIAGDQDQGFYDNMALNVPQLEDYVFNGGCLDVHAADQGWNGGLWSSLLPGGVLHNSPVYDQFNTIVDPLSWITEGLTDADFANWNYVSHGNFYNLYGGTNIILKDTTLEPTYIDYLYGTGYVIANTETLEWAYGNGYNNQVLVNDINHILMECEGGGLPPPPEHPGNILLLKDADPWPTTGPDPNVTVMNALGITHTVADSVAFPTLDLTPYNTIVIAADQPQTFYDNMAANLPILETYVTNGGCLDAHAADAAHNGGLWTNLLPGGIPHVVDYQDQNFITDPFHWVNMGLSDIDFIGWNYVSHGSFQPDISVDALHVDPFEHPTTIDYGFGAGKVLATTQALEWAFNTGFGTPEALGNHIWHIADCGGEPAPPTDVSWLNETPTIGTIPSGGI